jgi:hypothetical protein
MLKDGIGFGDGEREEFRKVEGGVAISKGGVGIYHNQISPFSQFLQLQTPERAVILTYRDLDNG